MVAHAVWANRAWNIGTDDPDRSCRASNLFRVRCKHTGIRVEVFGGIWFVTLTMRGTVAQLTDGFASGMSSSEDRPLSAFVDRIEFHFANKRRCGIVSMARDIMLNEDHNTFEITEEGQSMLLPVGDAVFRS